MYLERLSKSGMESSKYYQTKTFNHALGGEDDLPNCVQYDVCRTYEATCVDAPFVMFKNRSAGGYPDAGNWYSDTVLPKGSAVKNGSIACFTNHVAFIERVNTDGTCLVTDSRYDSNKSLRNDRYWRKMDGIKLVVGQYPNIANIGKFLGCIYLPIKDIRTSADPSKEQIFIMESMVNVRVRPDGDVFMAGCYAPVGLYDVLDTAYGNEGWKWYLIEEGKWVRDGEWIDYRPAVSDKELLEENERLKQLLREINKLSEV